MENIPGATQQLIGHLLVESVALRYEVALLRGSDPDEAIDIAIGGLHEHSIGQFARASGTSVHEFRVALAGAIERQVESGKSPLRAEV